MALLKKTCLELRGSFSAHLVFWPVDSSPRVSPGVLVIGETILLSCFLNKTQQGSNNVHSGNSSCLRESILWVTYQLHYLIPDTRHAHFSHFIQEDLYQYMRFSRIPRLILISYPQKRLIHHICSQLHSTFIPHEVLI